MRLTRRSAALAAAALLLTPLAASATDPTAPGRTADFQPWLEGRLAEVADTDVLRVAVRGETLPDARAAVAASGLAVQQEWRLVDTVVAVGTAAQVAELRNEPGVVYVEGDTPLQPTLETAHIATRSDQALATLQDADGQPVDGEGVSVAVIDSGIDGTHPMFQQDGKSKVVVNVKNVCGAVLVAPSTTTRETCFQDVPTNDTDTVSAGGHGTHVAGIAAGSAVTTTDPAGTELRGSAPRATLVGLSVGAAIGLLDAMSAQNWVLEHQQNPCRSAAEQSLDEVDPGCPPIRVTNHSYGPLASDGSDNEFTESSTAVVLQRRLVDRGVVAVWAAGNDGGDGEFAYTNPTGMDPTPGILMVASYDDGQTGNPDNALSSFSSRGKKGSPQTYPDLSAPGDRITSACRATLVVCKGAPSFDGGNYQTISGTSMAAPYVAGVVAQMFAADPTLTPAEVEDILEDTAHKFTAGGAYEIDPTNEDDTTSFDKGHGLVDVLAAVGEVVGQPAGDQEPAAALADRCVDGTDLVTDAEGDTNAPGGTGAPARAQDLTSVSFALADGVLGVTSTYADLSQTPAPGSTSTNNYVTWLGPDGVRYGVQHSAPGGGYRVGTFDPTSNRLVTGTTTEVTGTFTEGPGGTITWQVPAELVGGPAGTVDLTTDPTAVPDVRDSYALTIAGIGALGSGLVYTAPVDRAPDGGATPAWSVCNSEPVDQGDGDTGGGEDVDPQPEQCTNPAGKPTKCKDDKGKTRP